MEKNKIAGEIPEGTRLIWGRFQGEGGFYECDMMQKQEYAVRDGHALHLDIIKPMMVDRSFPLIVFIQGSAWRPQPIHMAYSKMFHMTAKGYVVAIVEYRNTDIAQYPAPVEDTLTETILYYARLRTAGKDVKIREFSAAQVVHEAVKDQMQLLMAANIRVETEGDFRVFSDEKSLCFILKQLLINCAKYCPGCQVQIRVDKGIISVRDNGLGIPSYELPRVTERGFTGNPDSTGMGLYIVQELCSRLGISMKIESQAGAFTCVTLSFDDAAPEWQNHG